MLSTYTVNSLADNGSGGTDDENGNLIVTLRYAIAQANANSDASNTITFSPALAGGSVDFGSGTMVLDHPSGDIVIQAPTGTQVTISAHDAGVFTVDSGTTAEFDNLVITDGSTAGNGGGIDNFGNITVNNCTLTGNQASGNGGAIANEGGGTATINNSTISNNQALGGGSAGPIQVTGPTTASTSSTLGSYDGNSDDDYHAAFDNNTSTYFDSNNMSGNYIQLDLGYPIAITGIGYAPRPNTGSETDLQSRMDGGIFEASNYPNFTDSSGNPAFTTLFTVTSTPPVGLTFQSVNGAGALYQYVRYVAPAGSYGNIAEMQVFNTTGGTGGMITPLGGTPSASTTGSYDNIGNGFQMAFDNNIDTYFDAPSAGDASEGVVNWIQMDLGSSPPVIDQISYAPREGNGNESRMVGGVFEVSNNVNFTSGVVTLFTVNTTPADGFTEQAVNPGMAYEYVRYVAPDGSYGNIAEMQVYTMDGAGAGIYNAPYSGDAENAVTVNNSTISDNIAPGRFGGAIAGGNATVNVVDSTISGNSGGGITGEGTVSIIGTITAENEGQDLSIPLDSGGSYDLIGDGSGGLTGTYGLATNTGDIVGSVTTPINPMLGPLQDNGGLTDTMAPLVNSPLLEGGETITGITTDQRGLPRPTTGQDIGAFQTQPLAITISPEVLTSESDPNIYVGQPTNFLIQGNETAAAAVTGFTVNFGDGDTQTISTPPSIADGGYYQWSVQHIYQSTPSTGGSFTVTATPIGTPETSTVPSTNVWVAATNESGLTISGITVESSTQVYLTWSSTENYDSYEVAAANTAAASLDYTVVAAAPGGGSGGVLISGLTPSTSYNFFIYGVYGYDEDSAGSVCSENSMSATTPPTPTITTYTDIFGGVSNIDGYSVNDGLSSSEDVTYQWEGFGTITGTGTSLGTGSSISVSEQYASVTVVAIVNDSPTGAFDSVTYYTAAPTIVVTGTSGNDNFTVSNPDGGSGPYTVTGSVTTIAPFYALNGINLKVEGRGGSDTLTIGSYATVTLITDPSLLAITNDGTYTDGYSAQSTSTDTAPTGLPAPTTLPSDPISSTPSGTDAFTLGVSSTATTAGLITQATATAAPGDVIALTAEDVSTSTTFYVYGQTTSGNGDWEAATIVSEASAGTDANGLASEAVSIQLPSTLPPNSIYYIYELNGSTYSAPYQINQPQIWWTDQNNAYVGGKVSLFGTNLSYGVDQTPYEGHTWVYLFPQGISGETSPILLPVSAVAPASDGSGAMDVNPYKVDLNLPSSLAAGTYEVEVYNGHGGVNALSNEMSIYVAATPSGSDTATFTLQAAYDNYLESNSEPLASVYLDNNDTQIDPFAVDAAIFWANQTYIAGNASIQYVTIDLPSGEIQVANSMDQIFLYPRVHLVGAGDTGNPTTGTVLEAGPGQSLQDLINIYDPGNNPYYAQNEAIAGMSLITNGSVYAGGAAVYCPASVDGFTISDVTINSTTDNPTAPGGAGDVYVNNGLSHGQFVDSTFIGAGVFGYFQYYSIDNCHFIGCGTVGNVISTLFATDFSITRCTDTSLVNSIASPGGNVESDSDKGLFAGGETGTGVYVAGNTTSDVYNVESSNGDGEQISVEPTHGSATNMDVAIYQNLLSGDGAESLDSGLDSVGISVNTGVNIVVVGNDISNVIRGVDVYNEGYSMPFAMYIDNSIHNVAEGLFIQIGTSSVPNVPWFMGCSFNNNLINGICDVSNFNAATPSAIYIITYSAENNTVPQVMMNVFNSNIVTGASVGIVLTQGSNEGSLGVQLGDIVFSNDFFESDGSGSSVEVDDLSGDMTMNPVFWLFDDIWEGYWS
jgi:hypothetical protein